MKTVLPLSVVLSTRHRPEAVAACLNGLLASTHVPFEIVVVDQSTNDATRHVTEHVPRQATALVYVRHHGQGLAASQNIAFEHARGDIVAVIDDDCIPAEDWLSQIARAFRTLPELGLVTGRVLPLGPPRPNRYPVSSRTSTDRVDYTGPVAPWKIGSGNNFAVRRDLFLRIGGCDVRLGPGSPGRGGVDMDLFYRLMKAGARARYEPDAVVYHERKSRAERMARRPMYGHGMGACFALWASSGDKRSLFLLAQWLAWRSARLAAAALRGRWRTAHEEALMVAWTFPGLRYGLQSAVPPHSPSSAG